MRSSLFAPAHTRLTASKARPDISLGGSYYGGDLHYHIVFMSSFDIASWSHSQVV